MLKQLLLFSNQIMVTDSESGGLFDFNATLPLMALQFLSLTLVLNLVFYKPVMKVLDERENYIQTNLESASEALKEAEKLSIQYEEELAKARKDAQNLIKNSQQEAQSIVAQEIMEAQNDANRLIEESTKQLNGQKEAALEDLEHHVETLSEQIYNKILAGQSVT
uniref:ATP synthase CF0 B' subunit n=1 Tax=Sciadococcus taiwanensis TaxID=3028030 RepID=A0A9Y1I268_9RHOD|nr:ATP synthase CF0 B' subunit [Sciadococcus taiwanensis]